MSLEEKLQLAIDALERLSRSGCKQNRNVAKQALEAIKSDKEDSGLRH